MKARAGVEPGGRMPDLASSQVIVGPGFEARKRGSGLETMRTGELKINQGSCVLEGSLA